jgi:2,4-dienoyl-CoA reductase-like NADH-dependent reductase (Old Yellow Enzyme family)
MTNLSSLYKAGLLAGIAAILLLADAVLLARQFLRDPYWPLHAAEVLGVSIPWPRQYERAKK